ncbi:MAG: protein kinase, partial [Opitutaceae bacterium]|nr:protein kinase [Opitutaceae bacterium]
MTPRPDSLSVCPRCGSTSAEPLAQGGVCLRCAGLRALSFGAADLSATETGERIGPYDVVEELGRGGMGRVVAACQPGHDRIVAVKSIRTGVDSELELRFRREIQTLSRLRHPNIVAIHDSGRAGDSLYFSMDYIEGGDLAARLDRHALPWGEAVPLLRKVARALVYLHAQGVLHRDLKPSNILLDDAEPKLADFGLAAQLEAGDLTALTRILGTPHYLAPEALLKGSTAATAAGDLYSFGVVFYETLTGRTPFAGASPEGLLNLVQTVEPPAIRQLVPSVPRDLETICLKCLDRDPSRRYATAAALEEDLASFQDGRPILARPISRAEQLVRWTRRRPELAAIWMLVFVVAAGATTAAVRIAREQTRTAAALAEANAANALARERLRTAHLAEARAVIHTTAPGRRAQALAALTEAAAVRPGLDLRDAALAALTTVDLDPVDTWNLQTSDPADTVLSANGTVAALRLRFPTIEGTDKHTMLLRERGRDEPLGEITTPAPILGPLSLDTEGNLLAVRLEDATLRIWSTRPLSPVCTLEKLSISGPLARDDQNADYALSPSGRSLAIGHPGGGVDLVALPQGNVIATWASPQIAQTLRYSPDGRWIAVGRVEDPSCRTVALLDGQDARQVGTLEVLANLGWWTTDSRKIGLITADNGCTWFTVPDCRRTVRTNLPPAHTDVATMLAAGDLLAYHPPGTALHLLDSTTGRTELILPFVGSSSGMAIRQGTELLTSSITNVITNWKPTPRPGWRIIPAANPPSTGYGTGAHALDASADRRWIVVADGTHFVVHDVASGRTA